LKKARSVFAVCIVMFFMVSAMSIRLISSVNAKYIKKECMPDFGQHSNEWCWVAAMANCFYWLKHYGGYPNLYPDSWDEIDSESKDCNSSWYCSCGNGYSTLLKEICEDGNAVHEGVLIFCSRFFLAPWTDYVDPYVECIEKFIEGQGLGNKLVVHAYNDPTFSDYKREIKRSTVIILYQWWNAEDIHLVTGVAYNTDKSPCGIEVSDPCSDLHNNDPTHKNYNKWEVTGEDPFETNAGKVRYLFCVTSTGVGAIWAFYIVLVSTVIVAIAITAAFFKYGKKHYFNSQKND